MKHKKGEIIGELPTEKMVKLQPHEVERVGKICDVINRERFFVDIKPYSHNIISMHLREAASIVDTEYANQLIDNFGLEKLGWVKVREKKDE